MPKPHGSTLLAAIIFVVVILIAYHLILGRRR